MGQGRQCVHALAVEEYVEFDELGCAEVVQVIVKRGIAFRDALELVVKVDDDLAEGHVEYHLHAVARDVFLLDKFAALAEAERHNRADIVGGGDDRRADIGLLDMVYEGRLGRPEGLCTSVIVPCLSKTL